MKQWCSVFEDKRWGETVGADEQLVEGTNITEESIQEYVLDEIIPLPAFAYVDIRVELFKSKAGRYLKKRDPKTHKQ